LSHFFDVIINLISTLMGFLIHSGWNAIKDRYRKNNLIQLWHPFLNSEFKVVISHYSNQKFKDQGYQSTGFREQGGFMAYGDAMATATLQAFFESAGITKFSIVSDENIQGDDLKNNLILIGGPIANVITKQVMEKVNTSFKFEGKDGAIKDSVTKRNYIPNFDRQPNEQSIDYSLVIFTYNPFDPTKKVIIIAGSLAFGTWAGARYLISRLSKKLAPKGRTNFECLLETDVMFETPQAIRTIQIRHL